MPDVNTEPNCGAHPDRPLLDRRIKARYANVEVTNASLNVRDSHHTERRRTRHVLGQAAPRGSNRQSPCDLRRCGDADRADHGESGSKGADRAPGAVCKSINGALYREPDAVYRQRVHPERKVARKAAETARTLVRSLACVRLLMPPAVAHIGEALGAALPACTGTASRPCVCACALVVRRVAEAPRTAVACMNLCLVDLDWDRNDELKIGRIGNVRAACQEECRRMIERHLACQEECRRRIERHWIRLAGFECG